MEPLKPNGERKMSDKRYHKAHTRGGFHLCSRVLLLEIEKKYNGFTSAKGCDYQLDGIIKGEIGFCQKILGVGYNLITAPVAYTR